GFNFKLWQRALTTPRPASFPRHWANTSCLRLIYIILAEECALNLPGNPRLTVDIDFVGDDIHPS
ncbi:MAG: hypothetical protein MUO77_18095, partial [Anaerolineales bacterium]|nr:hypothetical protein [Anaerolineales bacterium]